VRKQTLAEGLTVAAQGSLKVNRKCELGQTQEWVLSFGPALRPNSFNAALKTLGQKTGPYKRHKKTPNLIFINSHYTLHIISKISKKELIFFNIYTYNFKKIGEPHSCPF